MKILIIGTDLNGPNDLKTQGQYLRDLLRSNGMDVDIASAHRNPLLRILDTVYQILCLQKNDIVIVQVYSTRGIYLEVLAVWLGKLKKCIVISTLHGGNIPNVYRSNPIKRLLLNNIFNHSAQITVPSRFIAENIPSIANRYALIRNYIDLTDYRNLPKPKDSIRLFWMRSYHPTYDPLKAIKILEYIRNRNHAAELIMAGKDFGYLKETLMYAQLSKYADAIKISNVIDTPTKNQIAAQCNVYVCTNVIDNAPVSFIEMMAMGLPIVSTNVGGIPYYVEHKKQAWLSSDNSIEDMAESILYMHQHPELQTTLVTNGLSFIKEFSGESVLKKWVTLITYLTNKSLTTT